MRHGTPESETPKGPRGGRGPTGARAESTGTTPRPSHGSTHGVCREGVLPGPVERRPSVGSAQNRGGGAPPPGSAPSASTEEPEPLCRLSLDHSKLLRTTLGSFMEESRVVYNHIRNRKESLSIKINKIMAPRP